jgi:hypothetical protein
MWQHKETGSWVEQILTLDDLDRIQVSEGFAAGIAKEQSKRMQERHTLIAPRQWTGLVDKAGKDVFEGDIVKWTTTFNTTSKTVHTDAVTWCEDVVCFLLMPHCHELNGAAMEIIGNIYENPDLLQQTET